MAIEALLFFAILIAVLLVIAWRNGVFERGSQGDRDTDSAFPQIQPGGRSGESIRDPRARLDAGDHLGRR